MVTRKFMVSCERTVWFDFTLEVTDGGDEELDTSDPDDWLDLAWGEAERKCQSPNVETLPRYYEENSEVKVQDIKPL